MNDMSARSAGRDNRRMADDNARVLAFPRAPDAIELRHLRSFVAVAEELNFGRAADQLYLSQPALSRQIRALEQLVGCQLLRRSTHRVELTLAGEALLDRARKLLSDVDEAISVTQSVGDELATRGMRMWQTLADLTAARAGVDELREAFEALHAQFSPPPEIVVRPASAGGIPSLLVSPPEEPSTRLIYLHGGGYMLGSAFGYRHVSGALALAAGTGALVPDIRLAPEHPFPAALNDVLAAYRWLIDRGTDPGNIVLAGDSSGGGLALSALQALKRDGLPMPGGAVLLCPAVDLTFSMQGAAAEPQPASSADLARQVVDGYLAGHPIDDPLVSPLTADLSGLPPLLVQAATGDERCAEAQALAARAREHGVDARLELFPVATHVFQIFWSFLPEATEAIESAGHFVRAVATPRGAAASGGGGGGGARAPRARPAGRARRA
jgi:epsilon-lactone hydrolase